MIVVVTAVIDPAVATVTVVVAVRYTTVIVDVTIGAGLAVAIVMLAVVGATVMTREVITGIKMVTTTKILINMVLMAISQQGKHK